MICTLPTNEYMPRARVKDLCVDVLIIPDFPAYQLSSTHYTSTHYKLIYGKTSSVMQWCYLGCDDLGCLLTNLLNLKETYAVYRLDERRLEFEL